MTGKWWTKEEETLLEELWDSNLTKEEVASYFPNRTPSSVKVKAKRLGLRHTPAQTSAILSKKTSGDKNGMWGKPSPRRGVTLSKELRKKLSNVAYEGYKRGTRKPLFGEDNPMWGKTGEDNPMYDKTLPPSAIKTLSRKAKERWKSWPDARKKRKLLQLREGLAKVLEGNPSSIEVKVDSWLQDMGVEYESQKIIDFYIVDFLVDGYKVVEVYGDYWHAHPEFKPDQPLNDVQKANVRRDKAKHTLFRNKGIPMLVLWECDINNNPVETRSLLEGFLYE